MHRVEYERLVACRVHARLMNGDERSVIGIGSHVGLNVDRHSSETKESKRHGEYKAGSGRGLAKRQSGRHSEIIHRVYNGGNNVKDGTWAVR